jgi:SAM-dependent methyltransferase
MSRPVAGERTRWAARAEALYDEAYASRYREHDETLRTSEPYRRLIAWLGHICGRFTPPIDALDLGCGTGRYFWGLSGVRQLVGIDASEAMLTRARAPIEASRIDASSIDLVRGDLLTCEFESRRFDLVYSIGVLAEHVPLDAALVARVRRWLRPGGRFAFTTVHPESPSVPQTLSRRLARRAAPVLPGAIGRALHRRLVAGGRYGDERWVRTLLMPGFTIESIERFQTEVHLHCLCVARKGAE